MAMKWWCRCMLLVALAATGCSQHVNISHSGSMAQMIAEENRLYTFSGGMLQVFDITEAAQPSHVGNIRLRPENGPWFAMEGSVYDTLSLYGRWLLAGMSRGITVLDSRSAGTPEIRAEIAHRNARDPLVGHDGMLYQTLRSASGGMANDELVIYRMDNPGAIREIRRMPLWNPHGIAFAGGLLLVADGHDGLKGWELRNGLPHRLVLHVRGIAPYDILPDGDVILLSTERAIISGLIRDGTFHALSRIPVAGEPYVDGLELLPDGDHAFRHWRWQKRWADVKEKIQWIAIVLAVVCAVVVAGGMPLLVAVQLTVTAVWLCVMAVRYIRRRRIDTIR